MSRDHYNMHADVSLFIADHWTRASDRRVLPVRTRLQVVFWAVWPTLRGDLDSAPDAAVRGYQVLAKDRATSDLAG